jgi:hypothetical protein
MATQRYISTSFWDDEWIQTLDPSEKLLYLYLMTNPLTSIAGVYKMSIRRIVFDTGFNADTISHILRKFQEAKKAFHFQEYMILPTWPKHQQWESRSKIKAGIDLELEKLPESVRSYMVSIGYRYPIEGYPYDPNYSDSELDSDSKKAPAQAVASFEIVAEQKPGVEEHFENSPLLDIASRSTKPPKERDLLRDALAASFRAKVPEFASPVKENSNLCRLASAIRRKASADSLDPIAAAQGLLEIYWRLHESGKPYYAAFTPSKMLSAFEDLWAEYRKASAAADTSWLDPRRST